MRQLSINLFDTAFTALFEQVKTQFPNYQYHYKKHMILLQNEEKEVLGSIRLPLHISIDQQLNILEEEPLVLYLSLESGSAAINVMKGNKSLYHTTFSAYMTRKKQGVSQIKYLNKKGKSRAGSRVRLAKTIEFFESINTNLNKLFQEYEFERIALNCTTSLIPYLFNAKVACPFDKKDERLYKIPLHIPQSNYTHLDKCIKKLMAPILLFDPKDELYFENFISRSTIQPRV